jgi:ornithine--oxo-acid transaminase
MRVVTSKPDIEPAFRGGALPIKSIDVSPAYSDHVNPQWVRLLDVLEMNVTYERCLGTELYTSDGERILDFLSGYCVHNTGHNHPRVVAAVVDELSRNGPNMLQSHVPDLAGDLAHKLCSRAGGGLTKAFFCSSGSEGVETAIKFARANRKRSGVLYAAGAFHGLTCGALSLMEGSSWAKGFGPLLPDTRAVSFGNIEALERELKSRKFAAYIVEPIQSEGGIRVPDANYLQAAQDLCKRYGSLFVLDEVQTGMYRTGRFLAGHHFGVQPDMVILAKALSGGLIPVGAVLMTDDVYESVYHSLDRAIVHTSTFSENGLAMRAGLATLEVLENESLGDRALEMGETLRERLRDALSGYEMVKSVPGLGMLSGIEFGAPSSLALRLSYEAFQRIHAGLFGQMLVMRMFKSEHILTQVCGNNFMVLKVAPPLVVTDEQLDTFVAAIQRVVEVVHSSKTFWTDAIALARRTIAT